MTNPSHFAHLGNDLILNNHYTTYLALLRDEEGEVGMQRCNDCKQNISMVIN